jgi:hypothetical protein
MHFFLPLCLSTSGGASCDTNETMSDRWVKRWRDGHEASRSGELLYAANRVPRLVSEVFVSSHSPQGNHRFQRNAFAGCSRVSAAGVPPALGVAGAQYAYIVTLAHLVQANSTRYSYLLSPYVYAFDVMAICRQQS